MNLCPLSLPSRETLRGPIDPVPLCPSQGPGPETAGGLSGDPDRHPAAYCFSRHLTAIAAAVDAPPLLRTHPIKPQAFGWPPCFQISVWNSLFAAARTSCPESQLGTRCPSLGDRKTPPFVE
jgi:hypothetical protein